MPQQATTTEMREFIRRTLLEHGQWLAGQFQQKLEHNPNIQTRQLIDRMSQPHLGPDLDLYFDVPAYGRLFEIRGRRLRRQRKEARRNQWPQKANSMPRLKKTEWYAKTMYRGLGRLVAVLSSGISEEQLQNIRNFIAQNTHLAANDSNAARRTLYNGIINAAQ